VLRDNVIDFTPVEEERHRRPFAERSDDLGRDSREEEFHGATYSETVASE